jgi:type IV pilus assembly protein PilO
MNPHIKNITKIINSKPKVFVFASCVLSIALFGYLLYYFVHQGAAEELAALEAKVESLNDQILSEQRLARSLPLFRKEVRALETKLKLALKELPDQREIDVLLSTISSLAKNSGLEIGLFRPQLESKMEFYANVPIQITVAGTYHQVATFFDEVGKLNRIVNINKISLHDAVRTDIGIKITADCIATTFRYLDEQERAQQAAEAVTENSKKKRK